VENPWRLQVDGGPVVVVDRLTGTVGRALDVVGGLLDEYVRWCADRFTEIGVDFGDIDAAMARHHALFLEELPSLLGPRGRLLIGVLDGDVVGVGGLRPADEHLGEIKRMYVRPAARGRKVGRGLLERLLTDAARLGYREVRLETASFMTTAQALYRSMGFIDIEMFSDAEAQLSGFEAHMRFMGRRTSSA
jgi:ribosomal protein S18 acetylase RimI-like enzyme